MSTIEMRIEILWSVSNWFGQKVDTLQSAEHHAQKPFRTERAKLRQNCINCLCNKNVHKLLLLTYHVYHETHGRNFWHCLETFHTIRKLSRLLGNFEALWKLSTLSRNFPDWLETFKTYWKLSRLSGNFPDSPERFKTDRKHSGLSGNIPDYLETLQTVSKPSDCKGSF